MRWAGSGVRLLDVGCGDGVVLWNMANQSLHGMEISLARAQVAKRTLEDKGGIVVGNAESLPFRSGCFDVVLMLDAIEHIVDVRAALGETRRILRKDGRLVLTTPNIAFLSRRLQLLIGRFPSTSQPKEGIGGERGCLIDGGHLHYFTYRMMKTLLSEIGFRRLERMAVGRWQREMGLWPSLLSPTVGMIAYL
jgi:SAM-dependent methyltransferase